MQTISILSQKQTSSNNDHQNPIQSIDNNMDSPTNYEGANFYKKKTPANHLKGHSPKSSQGYSYLKVLEHEKESHKFKKITPKKLKAKIIDISHPNMFPISEKKSANTIINREYQVLRPEFFRKSPNSKKNRLSYAKSSSMNENPAITLDTNQIHSDRLKETS